MTLSVGRSFAWLWLSETSFDFGSALVGFALGVWIFEHTGSAEQFLFGLLAAQLPALLVLPAAGVLAERIDRRWVIAGCDLCAALLMLLLAVVVLRGELSLLHLYGFIAAAAALAAARAPSYQSLVGALVPPAQLTRANGWIGTGRSAVQVGAPAIAGALVATSGLPGVMVAELLLVAAGAGAVLISLSDIEQSRARERRGGVPPAQSMAESFRRTAAQFREQPLLLGLLAFALVRDGMTILVSALVTPMVLPALGSGALGLVLACGALGDLLGSLLVAVANVRARLMLWVAVCDALLALFVALAGFANSPWLLCSCAFLAMFASGASAATTGALWMRKLPAHLQGSVFSWIGVLQVLVVCTVMLGAGRLGEHVFEPALAAGGAWADALGPWLGTGKGRGFALLFVVAGAVWSASSLLALLYPGLRRLDQRVPDAA